MYALIFTDLSMPIVDGFTAARLIRQFYDEHSEDIPYIVACSGHTESLFLEKAFDCRIDEVA